MESAKCGAATADQGRTLRQASDMKAVFVVVVVVDVDPISYYSNAVCW